MAEAKKAQDKEIFTQSTGKAVDGLTVWADANQRVLREMAELCAASAREGVRLYAEIQQSMLEAMRDAQATTLHWQTTWQDAPRDPPRHQQPSPPQTAEQPARRCAPCASSLARNPHPSCRARVRQRLQSVKAKPCGCCAALTAWPR